MLLFTAKSKVNGKVIVLDMGANDYLTNSFSTVDPTALLCTITHNQLAGQITNRLTQVTITLEQATFEPTLPHGSFRLGNKELQTNVIWVRTEE